MDTDEARERFAAARVARLATVGPRKQPHLVPITFAMGRGPLGDVICFAVDAKPKSSRQLKRLANLARNPDVSVLVDVYDDDWTQLWWVRADGEARVVENGPVFDAALAGLRTKYPQYEAQPPDGPVVVIEVSTWRGWAAAGPAPDSPEAS